jgi:hypothetical protein
VAERPPEPETGAPDADIAWDSMARTRRGFIGAALAAIGSAFIIAILWLIARGAPSARRDPALASPTAP